MAEAPTVLLILALGLALPAVAAVALRRAARERRRAERLERIAAVHELHARLAQRGVEIQSARSIELRRCLEAFAERAADEPDDALLARPPRELRKALRRADAERAELVEGRLADAAAYERRIRALLDRIESQGKLITSLVEALSEVTGQLDDALDARIRRWRDRPPADRPFAKRRETGAGER